MPPLSAVRALSIATVLGPQVERQINWYLEPEHSSLLLIRLTPQLDKIAQVVLHYATSVCVVYNLFVFLFYLITYSSL